jgi:hypothetical protein
MTRLTAAEIAALDPYKFMAVIAKRVMLGAPVDTFLGAGGEEKARQFGTLGYSIRARKPA